MPGSASRPSHFRLRSGSRGDRAWLQKMLPRAALLVEDRTTQTLASIASLLGIVAGGRRLAFDGEELRDDVHASRVRPGLRSACDLGNIRRAASPAASSESYWPILTATSAALRASVEMPRMLDQ